MENERLSLRGCRFHIRQHYEIYKERCEKEDILINHWAIPRPIWKAMEEKKTVRGKRPVDKEADAAEVGL
jgi:hypothetical protein